MRYRLLFGFSSVPLLSVFVLFGAFQFANSDIGNQMLLTEQQTSPSNDAKGVAIILGAGGNIGKAVALKFKQQGYNVAVASRSGSDPTEGNALPLTVDVTKEEDIVAAFKQVKESFGAAPNVVVYNVGLLTLPPVEDDPFSLPYPKYLKDLESGAGGAFVAIQQAVTAWASLPADTPKVFIATSNIHGVKPASPVPAILSLASQKRLLAYLIEAASITTLYRNHGYRFYLASQVSSDGGSPGDEFSGEPHAIAYWNLIEQKEQGRWDVRFIRDGSVYRSY